MNLGTGDLPKKRYFYASRIRKSLYYFRQGIDVDHKGYFIIELPET